MTTFQSILNDFFVGKYLITYILPRGKYKTISVKRPKNFGKKRTKSIKSAKLITRVVIQAEKKEFTNNLFISYLNISFQDMEDVRVTLDDEIELLDQPDDPYNVMVEKIKSIKRKIGAVD